MFVLRQLAAARDAALAAALVHEQQAQAAQLAAVRDELAALRSQWCASAWPCLYGPVRRACF